MVCLTALNTLWPMSIAFMASLSLGTKYPRLIQYPRLLSFLINEFRYDLLLPSARNVNSDIVMRSGLSSLIKSSVDSRVPTSHLPGSQVRRI
ncbi:MAG: hypothetical protein QXN97_06900 [Desulfurococcaceae archaeon]